MKKPEFTEEQQNYLADIIGHWYLAWKHCIVVQNDKEKKPVQHKLGFAKEKLKELIYYPENSKEYIYALSQHGMIHQILELFERYPDLKSEAHPEQEQSDSE